MQRLVIGLACGAVLAALVWAVWPRPAPSLPLQAYAQLAHAPIPVETVGWIDPDSASAQTSQSGYVLILHVPELGELTIAGYPQPSALPSNWLTWRESGVTYALQTEADPRLVRSRLVSLAQAERQLSGNAIDTPLLYLWYVPVFLAFSVSGSLSVLLR
jgi:hypothetical protein